MSLAKDKIQKMKKTINVNRSSEEKSKGVIIENAETLMKENNAGAASTNDQTTFKLNAFLFLGVFPIVATSTLAYFNDDMREDLYNRLGIRSVDNNNRKE